MPISRWFVKFSDSRAFGLLAATGVVLIGIVLFISLLAFAIDKEGVPTWLWLTVVTYGLWVAFLCRPKIRMTIHRDRIEMKSSQFLEKNWTESTNNYKEIVFSIEEIAIPRHSMIVTINYVIVHRWDPKKTFFLHIEPWVEHKQSSFHKTAILLSQEVKIPIRASGKAATNLHKRAAS